MLLTPAQIKPESFESRRIFLIFFTGGGCASCLRACLGTRLLPQFYRYPNVSEGADRIGGQLRGQCPFTGQWRNQFWQSLDESDARSVDYATEGALFISTQLSTDAVSALRLVWVLI